MNRNPNFEIVESGADCLLIRDIGPWETYFTITNRPEQVVAACAPFLRGRRLEYLDSEGKRDQLLVVDGKFAGYAPAGPIDGPQIIISDSQNPKSFFSR